MDIDSELSIPVDVAPSSQPPAPKPKPSAKGAGAVPPQRRPRSTTVPCLLVLSWMQFPNLPLWRSPLNLPPWVPYAGSLSRRTGMA